MRDIHDVTSGIFHISLMLVSTSSSRREGEDYQTKGRGNDPSYCLYY